MFKMDMDVELLDCSKSGVFVSDGKRDLVGISPTYFTRYFSKSEKERHPAILYCFVLKI